MSGNGIHHLQNLIITKDVINKELLAYLTTKCNDLEDRVKILENNAEEEKKKKAKKWHWGALAFTTGLSGVLLSLLYLSQDSKNNEKVYF
jgi:hypothetical protein